VTPFKPRCVILQGISPEKLHPMVAELASRDRIALLTTEMEVTDIVKTLRELSW
jgi:putative transcriptional regulator